MIISGGVNIYPQETENLLITHPKVMDAAVIGVPNEDLGEEVKAVVQLMPDVEPGPELEQELLAFCRQHLAHFKCPRTIDFEAELPAPADRQAVQAPAARPLLGRHHVEDRLTGADAPRFRRTGGRRAPRPGRTPSGAVRPLGRAAGGCGAVGPGLAFVAVAVVAAFLLGEVIDVSPLVGGVVLGVVAANAGLIRPVLQPGHHVRRQAAAARRRRRPRAAAVVRPGARPRCGRRLAVVAVVVATLLRGAAAGPLDGRAPRARAAGGHRVLDLRRIGGGGDGATGRRRRGGGGLRHRAGDAVRQPVDRRAAGDRARLRARRRAVRGWAGAGVHDVGQVTATASAYAEESLAPALLVKLTRVILLAPLVAGVGLWRRRQHAADRRQPAARHRSCPCSSSGSWPRSALRATGWLSDDALARAKDIEQALLTAGMFGLGCGVAFARLRRLGGRPLALGLASWVLVAAWPSLRPSSYRERVSGSDDRRRRAGRRRPTPASWRPTSWPATAA